MKKVLTIGGATQDIFVTHKDPHMLRLYSKKRKKEYIMLDEGTKIEIEELSYFTGGGATNSATSFSRLGLEVATIVKTGQDCQAQLVIDRLKREHIDTSHIATSKKLHTGVSIIIPSLSGEQTVLAYRGANIGLTQKDISKNFIKNFDQLYITSLSGDSAKLLPFITQTAKDHNIPVATNPGASQLAVGAKELRESLKNIDIFILNAQEASEFMCTLMHTNNLPNLYAKNTQVIKKESLSPNTPQLLKQPIKHKNICFSLHDYFSEVLNLGPKIVIVTNGPEGVYVAKENSIYFQPSIPTQVVSTLGAGDSFGSCFVASIAQNYSLEESIQRGVINSSSVISYLDAKTGLLNKKELDTRSKELSIGKTSQFKLIKS